MRKGVNMTKADLRKEYTKKVDVLKELLLDEVTSRHEMDLNYKLLSDAVNDGIRKNMELQAEIKELRNSKIEVMTKAQEEIRKLKAELKEQRKVKNILREDLSEIRLKDKHGLYDEVKELQAENDELAKLVVDLKAEIKQLRADMTHDSEVCYDGRE